MMNKSNNENIDYVKKMREKFITQLEEYRGGDRALFENDFDDEIVLKSKIDILNRIIEFMENRK